MELTHLKTFVAVAEAGSLTQAGEAVHLSQPAVSAHIKALETQLGVRLFRRASRGMELTHEGGQLLHEAREVIRRADRLERAAQRLRGDVAGRLRVGIVDTGFDMRLGVVASAVGRGFPELKIDLVSSVSGVNTKGVLDQKLDAAIVEGEVQDDRLMVQALGHSRVGVIVPAGLADEVNHTGWARLSEFPWVFQSKHCSYCRLLEAVGEQHHVTFQPQFRAEAVGAVRDLVASGVGISVSDLDAAQPLVDAGLVLVWPHFEYNMPVSLVTHRDRADEPMVRVFAEQMQQAHRRPEPRRRAKPVTRGR
ncbi:MAG: LysR family transcriptional regulator [Phycisphaeraceae bacterium]|nr:LysR family transcriptional regulator [Phycisphaeraceae bacterium]